MYIIYKLSNNIDGKIYIGQTSRSLKIRFNEHCLSNSGCHKVQSAIKKYGRENFKIELITITGTQSVADYWEIYFIDKYQTLSREYGYNIRDGGSVGKFNNKGRKHTPDELSKMSKSQIGRIISFETRQKMSEAKKDYIPWNKRSKTNLQTPNPKLLPRDQLLLIANDKRSAKIIAKEYGISKTTVLNIRNYIK